MLDEAIITIWWGKKKGENIMSYSIVEKSANDFIGSSSSIIKLPRFQRKQTWKAADNFKLCISVFKGYPIGVVIINEVEQEQWLLDGRQRRNALKLMKENPIEVYEWAKAFIKFKNTSSEDDVRNKFWSKIDIYLQTEMVKDKDSNNNDDSEYDENDIEESSFNAQQQYASLSTLLELILLNHSGNKNIANKFDYMFKFNGSIPESDLKYVIPVNGNYKIDPVKLQRKLQEIISESDSSNSIPTKDEFIKYFLGEYRLTKDNKEKFKNYVTQNWSYYKNCLDIIKRSQYVIERATVGVIRLVKASTLDAQNIFSLVNDGGTKLTAEELLSARPFWNRVVANPSEEVKEWVGKLYKELKIDVPEEIYRWDLGATLLLRLDKNHIVFQKLELNEDNFKNLMSLGFKLLSAIYEKGISTNHVINLEKNTTIDWNVGIDKLIQKLNMVIDIISRAEFFKFLHSWKKSIMELITNAAAQEFLVLLYMKWVDMKEPAIGMANAKKLQRYAVILFDRLMYEYCTKVWKGSSDSKFARDLKNIDSSLTAIPEQQWMIVIKEFANGTYNGDIVSFEIMKSLVYYYCALREFIPTYEGDNTCYEVDHLIAQNIIKKAESHIDVRLKDSFINLSPLPKNDNCKKNDKPLNKIDDPFIKDRIKCLADFEEKDFETFSDACNIEELKNKRLPLYIEAFSKKREKWLTK